jgi:mono/diheme cytochrome c family protein
MWIPRRLSLFARRIHAVDGADTDMQFPLIGELALSRRHPASGRRGFRRIADLNDVIAPVSRPSLFALAAMIVAFGGPAAGQDDAFSRGAYLVTIAGCSDCHTPGHFLGQPDVDRYLGGSEVGFAVPGLGTFYGPNLTPDDATGLGTWSEAQIVAAITTGVRPDGRQLAPVMPWMGYSHLTEADAQAIAAYLKSLPAVSNTAPGPFGPDEAPTSFSLQVVPPGG